MSRDIKLLYNADGFIQIPLLDVKELYGIKFNVPADGETFYAKIVTHMGKLRGVSVFSYWVTLE